MPQPLSVNQLSDLTGRDRRTVTTRLASLPCEPGPKGAHLYDSALALAKIYIADDHGKSLEQARTDLAIKQAVQVQVKTEELQRERIPHDVIDQVDNETFQAIAGALKNAKGKLLDEPLINTLFAAFRGMPPERVKAQRKARA